MNEYTHTATSEIIFRHDPQGFRRIVYHRDIDKPLIDCPTVFFHIDFIRYPCFGWTIDFSGAKCGFVSEKRAPCHETCMAGVLLKHPDPYRVWRLTGRRDPDTDELVYEGKWPD
jgi:hypothetical protein